MVTLVCALVGVAGSAFPVDIEGSQLVGHLKDAIKAKKPNTITCDANALQLFLAKKDGAWMGDADPSVLALEEGRIYPDVQAMIDGEKMRATWTIKDVLEANHMTVPQPRQIHVLVVVPQQEATVSTKVAPVVQKFNVPIEFSELTLPGGVPSSFRTARGDTVAAFARLLDSTPLIFVRAPPLSGKTAMCELLYNHLVRSKPNMVVARVDAHLMPDPVKFCEYFEATYECTFRSFSKFESDRVILVDEAQITYDDELLWRGYLKATLDGVIRGMRFVFFSSYGSFNVYRKHERVGTPITIPTESLFGLNATPFKPGLRLTRVELGEMVQNSIGALVSNLIWILSSGHIGIARAILIFLHCKFGSTTPKIGDVEMELRSAGLLDYIRSSYRGIPTAGAFQELIKNQDLSEDSTLKMSAVLKEVAAGKVMLLSDEQRSPGSQIGVELLTKFGFLYEDHATQLQFASSMHLKIWLYSNRTDPIGYMVSDVSHEDFVVMCVQRMSASRLQNFATENATSIARERQIQMELYGATTSCLPRDVLVTPEWRTDDGKGFIDLVIRGSSVLWFWELLVNGDDAVGHSKRFETGGKYYGSQTTSSKYVLIDFRQNKSVRDQKHGFLYVSFADSYTKALISSRGKPVVSVELSS